MKNFLATRWGIVCVGGVIGILAALLQKWGNPGNMGICVACFERDIAGAVGMHRAGVVQYMRPEIIGFVLGALIAAFSFKDFRPRSGSAPIVRFVLGMIVGAAFSHNFGLASSPAGVGPYGIQAVFLG
ncbi:MAG: hypothetical protein ACQERT_14355, partial [Thermodesulfobacteriota bacterium]